MLKVARSAARFLASAALAASLSGCANGKIWSFDEKVEVDKSSEQHAVILKRSGITASTDLQDYVATVGRKVAATSDCPKVAWTFSLLDSPQAQASSMPGGFVYLNRGLMEMLRSENELAAVLAHEVAHICTHDASRREAIGQVAAYGNLGLLWSINPWALTSIFVVPEIALLPGIGTTAALSRHDEFNADRHGTEYLRRAGYPPEAMSAALEVLDSVEAYDRDHRKKGERVFGRPVIPMGSIYADHPTAAKRRSKLGRVETPVSDPSFLARLDGLVFGSTNRDGIASGSTPVVRVREAQEGDTFASLAKTARIPDAEAQLRLLNTRYPSGEPKVGQLVKVIE